MASRDNIRINEDERIIYFSDSITNETVGIATSFILSCIAKDDKSDNTTKDFKRTPIKMFLASCGGYVHDAWGLIDVVSNSQTPVYTYCTAYAYSAAFLLFLVGKKRYISDHGILLCHQIQASFGDYGKLEDVIDSVAESREEQRLIEEYIISRTNLTQMDLDEIRECRKDRIFRSKEALTLHIATDLYNGI